MILKTPCPRGGVIRGFTNLSRVSGWSPSPAGPGCEPQRALIAQRPGRS